MSKSKTIVLHAGLPKTGTTYLQHRFDDNRAWLEARGKQVLNAKSDREIFAEGRATSINVLRPDVLYARIPSERFAAASRAIERLLDA